MKTQRVWSLWILHIASVIYSRFWSSKEINPEKWKTVSEEKWAFLRDTTEYACRMLERSESSISIRRMQQSYLGFSVYININTGRQETKRWDFGFSFQIWTQQGEKKWHVLTWPWVYTEMMPWLCSTCTHKKLFKAFLPLSSSFKAQTHH